MRIILEYTQPLWLDSSHGSSRERVKWETRSERMKRAHDELWRDTEFFAHGWKGNGWMNGFSNSISPLNIGDDRVKLGEKGPKWKDRIMSKKDFESLTEQGKGDVSERVSSWIERTINCDEIGNFPHMDGKGEKRWTDFSFRSALSTQAMTEIN